MVKQQVHLRKVKGKLILAGKGKKPTLVGKLVWYNKKSYVVIKKNSNNTYNLKNLTERLVANNVPRRLLRLYK